MCEERKGYPLLGWYTKFFKNKVIFLTKHFEELLKFKIYVCRYAFVKIKDNWGGGEEVILSHPADFIVLKKIHSAGGGGGGAAGSSQLVRWENRACFYFQNSRTPPWGRSVLRYGICTRRIYETEIFAKNNCTISTVSDGFGAMFYCCNRSV